MAHALHTHRTARHLRNHRSVHHRVTRVVSTIRSRALNPNGVHLVDRHLQESGYTIACVMWFLAARPQGDAIGLDIGHRTGWAHAGVRLERPVILGLHHSRCIFEGDIQVTVLFRQVLFNRGRLADVVKQLAVLRKRPG